MVYPPFSRFNHHSFPKNHTRNHSVYFTNTYVTGYLPQNACVTSSVQYIVRRN